MAPFPLVLAVAALAPSAQMLRADFDAFLEDVGTAVVARTPRAAALEAQGLVGHREPHLGVPSFYWAMQVGAAAPDWARAGLSAEEAARRYLYALAPLWGFDGASLAGTKLLRLHDPGTGAVVVGFRRELHGVPLFRDALHLVLTRDNGLVAASGWLSPHDAPADGFRLLAPVAVATAAQDALGAGFDAARLVEAGDGGAGWVRYLDRGGAAQSVRARKVWFELPDRLEAAWHLELEVQGPDGRSRAFAYAVSAADGRVLLRKSLTETAAGTYRAWADPTTPFAPVDSPQGTSATPHPTAALCCVQPAFVPQAQVTLDYALNPRSDPWLPGGAATLDGNNAVAYADLQPPQGLQPDAGDLDVPLTAAQTFDYPYDPLLAPTASAEQARAAATQAFFVVNWLHDWLYASGFDEAAGNAQRDNLGRGGLGGDALRVEAADWAWLDESAMTAFADGQAPRLELGDALVRGPSFVVPDPLDGGALPANQSNMGPQDFLVSGPLVLMADGVDAGYDGCDPLTDPASLQGAVALAVGARCPWRDQALAAQDAGAVGLVVGSTVLNALPGTLSGDPTGVVIPMLSLGGRDTQALQQALLDGGTFPQAELRRPYTAPRTAALDATVVAHEYGHLLLQRLVGNGAGLTAKISRSAAEGFCDYLALLATIRPGDDAPAVNAGWNGVYAIGGYFAGGSAYDGRGNASHYLGVRRYPYSVDTTKNGLSFRHIREGATLPLVPGAPFGSNSDVHQTGEVLAVALWEGLTALLRDPRLTYPDATRRSLLYLVGALKAMVYNPDLLEARDALLAVAWASDPADFDLLLAAFARRGMGPRAIAPPKTSLTNTPVTEDVSTTGGGVDLVDVTLDDAPDWCDRDGTLDQGERGTLTVRVRNRGGARLDGVTAQVSTFSTGVTLEGGGALAFLPLQPFQVGSAALAVTLDSATDLRALDFTVRVTSGGVSFSQRFDFRAHADVVASATEDFEADLDWQSGWTRGGTLVPFPGFEAFFQQRRASPLDTQLFLPDMRQQADVWARTPAMQVGAAAPLRLTFNHRWSFETDVQGRTWDGAFLEVSEDGVTWTKVAPSEVSPSYNGTIEAVSNNPLAGEAAFVGQSPGYPAWVPTTVDLGNAWAGKTITLRFRFGGDPGQPAPGWELDDLAVTGLTNQPFRRVVADQGVCVQRGPRVDAGPDRDVDERSEVVLGGTATDPDGDPVTKTWSQLSGPPVALNVDTFTAPEVTSPTPLVFELVASDGNFVRRDQVTLTVVDVNRVPQVTVEAVAPVRTGAEVTLQGAATDEDGDPLTFAWTQTDGPTVTLQGADQATATFSAPAVSAETTLTFELQASDGKGRGRALLEVVVRPQGCGCGAAGPGPLLAAGAWALARALVRRRRAGRPGAR